jgi:uncharacterized protein (TIGR02646 family)
MKWIDKQKEPQAFLDWKQQANEDWKPTFSNLGGSVKTAVKQALMTEQGYICCYCESRLIEKDSHIEHFRPQSDSDVDPLDYSNLLCSCQRALKKGEPRHCGNLKSDWFDSDRLISPLDATCETCFTFTADGYIQPTEEGDLAAKTTIEKLGLDSPKLRTLRQSAIAPFILVAEGEELSAGDMRAFVTDYLKQSENGEFSEFWTTIRYLFGAM